MRCGEETPHCPMTPKAPRGKSIFLCNSREIQVVKQQGRRISTGFFNLLAHKMDDAPSRVGIIVGKRFGNAVRRNRAKRVFRELARQLHPDLVPGRGLLVFPKRDALLQSHEGLVQAWRTSLERLHLLRVRAN
jgi:ribonuclease P protein component